MMRIVIIGAGAIGCVLGGYLWRAGHPVILIGRAGQVNAINEYGLKIIAITDIKYLRMPAVTKPDQINFTLDDVVFLTVKSQNTEEALYDLKAAIKDIPVFCFQNGVRNEEIAARSFSRVYGATFGIGAEYLIDGEVYCSHEAPGRILLGHYSEGTDKLANNVAQKLIISRFFVKITTDIMPYKWGKLMVNLANVVDAITNNNGKEVQFIIQAAQGELTDLLKLSGTKWISQEELDMETHQAKMLIHSPGDRPLHSSTWQSLTRQTGSVETEFLNGEVVRLARKLNRNAPVNEKLTQIIQEMATLREKPGKYTPTQLRSILGL